MEIKGAGPIFLVTGRLTPSGFFPTTGAKKYAKFNAGIQKDNCKYC